MYSYIVAYDRRKYASLLDKWILGKTYRNFNTRVSLLLYSVAVNVLCLNLAYNTVFLLFCFVIVFILHDLVCSLFIFICYEKVNVVTQIKTLFFLSLFTSTIVTLSTSHVKLFVL